MIMNLNKRLHESAQTLNDGKFLARLSSENAIVQELKHHFAIKKATKRLKQECTPKEDAHP